MTHRVYIAGVFQETNVFSPIPCSLASFQDQFWRPSEQPEPPSDVNLLGYGAVMAEARRRGLEVIPGLYASAVPAAPSRRADWETMKGEIIEDLRRARPVDMVFLFLHGAMAAQGVDDCEGDLLAAVRETVGPGVPIAAEFDLHGNVSAQMAQAADMLIACHEYPHIDFPERGIQGLDLLQRTAQGEIKPLMAAVRVPILAIAPTTAEPVKGFVARLRELETRPGVLCASAFTGFFGADHDQVGGSVVIITNGDRDLAERLADEVARDLVSTVRSQTVEGLPLDAALDQALATDERVVLADRADNAGGGAGGDSTFILSELLKRGVRDAALGIMWDPVAADFCHKAGVGARLPLRLGGKVGPLSGPPLDADAEVLAVSDDVRQAWFGQGEPNLPLGRSAAVRIDGIDVVISSVRHQVFSRHAFEGHGIDLDSKRLIVVKSTQHFHAAFSPLGRVIYCDPPGTVTFDLNTLPYRRLRRPIWPLDTDFDPQPRPL